MVFQVRAGKSEDITNNSLGYLNTTATTPWIWVISKQRNLL